MNKLDKAYTDLLQDILDNGTDKMDRTGTGTISVFGRQIRHNMKDGFPLLTTKKMPFKTIATELLWFLRGDTNIKYLVDNNCHIWDGDCYNFYLNNPDYKAESVADLMSSQAGQLVKCSTQEEFINKIKTDDEFAKKWGDLGPVYGKQWRKWTKLEPNVGQGGVGKTYMFTNYNGLHTHYLTQIDQIANLINDLKTNPDSRRLMVNAWNVGELDSMVLPPCHYGFQVYTRELSQEERWRIRYNYYPKDKQFPWDRMALPPHDFLDKFNIPRRAISLMWNQRSVDTFLGLPFNIASYGLLLEIIAKEVNMISDELIGNLGDVHLYSNHIEQAKEQIGRELSYGEKVEYTRSLYGEEEWWNINDKRVIEILQSNKRTREPFPLPTLKFNPCPITGISIDYLSISQFEVENYQAHPTIKAPLSN